MVAIRYYRQYLWIFFYSFFFLMALALMMDSYHSIAYPFIKGGRIHLSRFLNVLVCFFFSGIGIIFHHFSSRGILGLRFLYDRKRWVNKRIRLKRRSLKKAVKRRHLAIFCLINSISNAMVMVPFLVIIFLQWRYLWIWNTMETRVFDPWFFCIALFIKYVSWFFTVITSRFSIFLNKRRLNRLM